MSGMEPAMMFQIASTAFSAIGQLQQGQAQSSAAKYNENIARNNAIAAQQQATANAETQRRRAAQVQGAMRASIGASGVSAEGSALDLLESSAMAAEMDTQNILYQGKLKSMGYTQTAELEKMRGRNAMSQAYSGAGSALIGGFAKMGGFSGGSWGREQDLFSGLGDTTADLIREG